jgi:hypothetical protein
MTTETLTKPEPHLGDQVKEIIGLDEAINSSKRSPELIELGKLRKIEAIVGETLDHGTVSYGLRVLSEHRYPEDKLRELANEYNERGREHRKESGLASSAGAPHIHFLFMETTPSEFRQVDLDYHH